MLAFAAWPKYAALSKDPRGLLSTIVTALRGLPAEATAYGKLDAFIARLLASASTANAYSAAATKPIRVRKD